MVTRHLASQCLFLGVAALLASCAKNPTASQNTSARSAPAGQSNFAYLMNNYSTGRAKITPWVGYWWPYSEGGISSPAALYEQASGTTGAAAWEAQNHGPKVAGLQQWWGHCNGWAAAAALYPEPTLPVTQNGVTFSVADQKGLLSEIAMEVDADFFGQRDDSDDPSNLTFQDVFPNQFFMVLTNYMGNGLQVVMDRYTGSQVWNQPIAGYQHTPITPSDVIDPDPSAPGVYRVGVTTQVWWARDDVPADTLTGEFNFQDSANFQSRILRYEVWLDGPVSFDSSGKIANSGNVILARSGKFVTGGAWTNGTMDVMNSHPDYLWVPHRASTSTGFSNPNINQAWVGERFGRGTP